MRISQNWLGDFVDIKDINVKDFWLKFTLATAEVEDVIYLGKDINNVVVGKIKDVSKHPNSKKLKIVKVDLGAEIVQSLCGASNVKVDALIPFAKVGGSIKNIPEVKETLIAGIESRGICCSEAELGISDNHDGLFILDDIIDGNISLGMDIKNIIDIDDVIIEIDNKSITNRPDLWGHYGIAREVAAILGRPLKKLRIEEVDISKNSDQIKISISDKEACRRYSCVIIEGVKSSMSSQRIRTRLYYCGMRPINLLVDLTNYVMLEIGQPMHAFERGNIEEINVKFAKKGQSFKTLDGVERILSENNLMICDQEKPIALAGVMGGENSEVSDYSNSIILESANFDPYVIRRSGIGLGIRTEASSRFEKSLDPNNTFFSIRRFLKLLREIENDFVIKTGIIDKYVNEMPLKELQISKDFIDRIVGVDIGVDRILQILKSLEFGVEYDNNVFSVEVPSFRATKDISIKEDIIEEITRIYGYDNIQAKFITVPLKPLKFNKELLVDNKIKEILAEKFGLCESTSYIWYDNNFNKELGIKSSDSCIKVLNPQSPESDTLREWMGPTMIGLVAKNVRNFEKIGIFEIGSVFRKTLEVEKCDQFKYLSVVIADKSMQENDLFYRMKGLVHYLLLSLKNIEIEFSKLDSEDILWSHKKKNAKIKYCGHKLGYLTLLNPAMKLKVDKKTNVAIAEINLNSLYAIEPINIRYIETSRYPEVYVDFSLLVKNDLLFETLFEDIKKYNNPYLISFKFITSYIDNKSDTLQKSITFRFCLGSREKTLTSEDISSFSNDFIRYVQEKGATIQGL